MSGLPEGRIVRTFSRMGTLQVEARNILKWFEDHDDGNQWIVVLGLPPNIIERLDNDPHTSLGGVTYRFQWEQTTGLIKVVSSHIHEGVTRQFANFVTSKLVGMGIPLWFGATTYRFSAGKGKQGDDVFVPPSRCLLTVGWPTLVIETGFSESLPRLRQDAFKWFADSNGEVRFVILVKVRSQTFFYEKWYLAPPNAPRPFTRAYTDMPCSQVPNTPPLITQPVPVQQPYCASEVRVTLSAVAGQPNLVVGAPMVFPFVALYDRLPAPGENDIFLQQTDFECMSEVLLLL
ncbi:unnamed protein product [Penicillium egyptiacum]|uniref:Uncharacterized protein n=1 Tax=Penicillium egyptiacum TaxID=1303716 RepID=A0A9W4P4S9_9EURO|nr:unnamed protein product [Penicillium egyptiacum]